MVLFTGKFTQEFTGSNASFHSARGSPGPVRGIHFRWSTSVDGPCTHCLALNLQRPNETMSVVPGTERSSLNIIVIAVYSRTARNLAPPGRDHLLHPETLLLLGSI